MISMDEDVKSANVSDSCQRSPESMLCESQETDLLLCHDKFSPEIISKHTTVSSNTADVHENDNMEVENIAKCDKEYAEELPFEEDSNQQKVENNNCCLLDKTLSMNDDIAREMKTHLHDQQSLVITDYFATKTTLPVGRTTCGLQTKYVSAPTILNRNDKYGSELVNDAQSSFNESERFGSSIYDSVDGHDGSRGNNLSEKRKTKPNNDKSFDMNENISKDLSENWNEFRKIFTYLQQINKRLSESSLRSGSLFSKRKKFVCDDRRFHYALLSPVSSFASSHTSSSSPKSSRNCRNSTNRNVTRILFANEHQSKSEKSLCGTKKTPSSSLRRSITPCSGSSPSAKCCRAILKYEDEDKEVKKQSTVQPTRAEVVEEPIPSMEKKMKQRSIPLNLPSSDNVHWHSMSSLSESIPISDVELPAVSDYNGGNSLHEVEYQNDSCKRHQSPSTATLQDSKGRTSRRRDISSAIIARITDFCIWLMKKLLHLLRSSYKKLRQVMASFLSSIAVASWFENSRTNELNNLLVMLRSDNEKLLLAISEKITTDFIQRQTSTEATLNVLIGEVKSFSEVSKKMNENNIMLMQELKKLHKMLEKVQLESIQDPAGSASSPVALPSSPPLPSLSILPPHKSPINEHILELQQPPVQLPPPPPPLPPPSFLSIPPPSFLSIPPPIPSISLHSPMPPIGSSLPTTPNSSRNKKNRVTPTRKCSTPLLNRPSITVEDLLKVTLKKAPQNIKDKRNTVPGPRGPIVSLDMLRNVKLKSARRKTNDQAGRSPRGGRIVKSRVASSLNVSPIMVRSENNLERILRQVDMNRRGSRRLLSGSASFREFHDFSREEMRVQSLKTLKHSQSQSAIA